MQKLEILLIFDTQLLLHPVQHHRVPEKKKTTSYLLTLPPVHGTR